MSRVKVKARLLQAGVIGIVLTVLNWITDDLRIPFMDAVDTPEWWLFIKKFIIHFADILLIILAYDLLRRLFKKVYRYFKSRRHKNSMTGQE